MTGAVRSRDPITGEVQLEYRCRVIRVWELPVEAALSGPLATLPLAPLTAVSRAELPNVIAAMKKRLEGETTAAAARELWSAAYLLMGLKYPNALNEQLLKGVQGMEDSMTYQAILQKGKAEGKMEGVREILFRVGSLRYDSPDPEMETALNATSSLEHLELLVEGLYQSGKLAGTAFPPLLRARLNQTQKSLSAGKKPNVHFHL